MQTPHKEFRQYIIHHLLREVKKDLRTHSHHLVGLDQHGANRINIIVDYN